MLNKDFLRKKYLDLRKKLPAKAIVQKSKKMSEKLLAINGLRDKNLFLIYLPINNEVKTHYIIDALLDQEKKVLLPCYSARDREYHFCEFKNFDDLEEGPYGILQPSPPLILGSPKNDEGSVSDSSKVEVAIIPGVAFDKYGVRLGYGKGVYDRLLEKSKAVRIGLAYDFQVVDEIPKEKHDLVIDIIVTEKRIFRIT